MGAHRPHTRRGISVPRGGAHTRTRGDACVPRLPRPGVLASTLLRRRRACDQSNPFAASCTLVCHDAGHRHRRESAHSEGLANPYELDKDGRLANIQGLKPDYSPGDLAFDPLGLAPSDPAEFRKMQERELSHGRLAMFAAAGFLAQETVTGKTWGQQDIILENKVLGPLFEAASVEAARDALAKDLIPSLVDKAVF